MSTLNTPPLAPPLTPPIESLNAQLTEEAHNELTGRIEEAVEQPLQDIQGLSQGEIDSLDSLVKRVIDKEPVSLINAGQNCFLNALFQSLFNQPAIIEAIMQLPDPSSLRPFTMVGDIVITGDNINGIQNLIRELKKVAMDYCLAYSASEKRPKPTPPPSRMNLGISIPSSFNENTEAGSLINLDRTHTIQVTEDNRPYLMNCFERLKELVNQFNEIAEASEKEQQAEVRRPESLNLQSLREILSGNNQGIITRMPASRHVQWDPAEVWVGLSQLLLSTDRATNEEYRYSLGWTNEAECIRAVLEDILSEGQIPQIERENLQIQNPAERVSIENNELFMDIRMKVNEGITNFLPPREEEDGDFREAVMFDTIRQILNSHMRHDVGDDEIRAKLIPIVNERHLKNYKNILERVIRNIVMPYDNIREPEKTHLIEVASQNIPDDKTVFDEEVISDIVRDAINTLQGDNRVEITEEKLHETVNTWIEAQKLVNNGIIAGAHRPNDLQLSLLDENHIFSPDLSISDRITANFVNIIKPSGNAVTDQFKKIPPFLTIMAKRWETRPIPGVLTNWQKFINFIFAFLGISKQYYKETTTNSNQKIRNNLILNNSDDPYDVDAPFSLPQELIYKADGAVDYNLSSFMVHEGSSPHSGHYVAYVKKNGIWYHCSDASIKEVRVERVKAQVGQAYMYFYTRAPEEAIEDVEA